MSSRLRAFLATRVALRYDDTAAGIDEQQEFEAVYGPLDDGLDLDAETVVDFDDRDFRPEAPAGAAYVLPAAPIGDAKFFAQAGKDVQARLVANRALEIFRNKQLKLTSRPGETAGGFARTLRRGRPGKADAEAAKLKERLEAKRTGSRTRSSSRSGASRSSTRRRSRGRRTSDHRRGSGARCAVRRQAQRALDHERGRLGRVEARPDGDSSQRRRPPRRRCSRRQDDLTELEQEILDEVTAIDEKWKTVAGETIETVAIRLEATDVRVTDVRLVWVPVD